MADTLATPVVVKAGIPVIHRLDTCPLPEIVDLSTKPVPVSRPADFFYKMQNFNTEQGLALSTILCGFKDKAGNLWFGTSGNGVSMYDGKSFSNYNSSYGLIHNLIDCITEDKYGNIWFGTYGGVSKYDGIAFENFTMAQGLPVNDINRIFEDKKGNIWISSKEGISRFFPENKRKGDKFFINYSTKDGLPGSLVSEIIQDSQGNLWFGTDYGLSRYDEAAEAKGEKAFVNYVFGSGKTEVNTIVEGLNGLLWVGTTKGLLRFDPAKSGKEEFEYKLYTTDDGLINNNIICSCADREGNIWVGSKIGLSEFRIKDSVFVNITTKQGLANNRVNSITEDDQGSIWFGTDGGGLSRYDGQSVTGFTADQGLPVYSALAITEDRKGLLWFCDNYGRFASYNVNEQDKSKKNFTSYTPKQGFPENASFAMITDKAGNIWFSADKGLSKFNGKTIVNYSMKQGLINDNVVSLKEDSKGRLWIGTYENGISVFDGKSFTNYTTGQGLVHNTVWSFYEDKKGNIWMATRGGLSLFDGKTFMNFTTAQGLTDNKLSYVTEDKSGNILIGSWGGGISVIRKSIADKLTSKKYALSNGPVFENYTTNEGLSNDVVYGIIEDKTGNIFIGTSLGFTVLKGGIGPSGHQFARDGIEYFNRKTGYPIKDISNNYSMFLDSKNIIWAGTSDKLVRFDYSKVHRSTKPPKVLIQSIKVNNENISWYTLQQAKTGNTALEKSSYSKPPYIGDEMSVFGRYLSQSGRDTLISHFRNVRFDSVRRYNHIPENLVLSYAFNNISFDFVGIATTRSNLVQYQYMLQGYDKNWSPVTNKSTAGFGNISAGEYTFMLKARSPDGVWSEPVTYSFEIRPPWYLSHLAYFFYFLIFILGIFIVDRFQRNRLINKERQRMMKRELEQAKLVEKSYIELKAAQVQLIQAEKMASLGELTAGIAHEIQNPLNFVNNFSEVNKELISEMKEELRKGNIEEVNELANNIEANEEKINQHGKRADAIVKGMLQHSRSSSGIKEPTDINALADEYLRLSYHGLRAKDKSFNATMETDFDSSIGNINIIPQDIGRVILNLINNAFYAVNEKKQMNIPGYKPTVSVSTKLVISPSAYGGQKRIELKVADNGNGIPQIVLDKIFQPFFTTKPSGQGTGLGLSLSYDIVKAHGGELKVETKENEGTAFIIQLISN